MRFPPDILIEIVRVCSVTAVAVLMRGGRQTYAICEPILYQSTRAVRWAVLTSTDEVTSLRVLAHCKQHNIGFATVRLHNVPISSMVRHDRSYDNAWECNEKQVATMTPFQCGLLKGLDRIVCFLLENGFSEYNLLDRPIWRCLLFFNRHTDDPVREADDKNHSFSCEHIVAATGLHMVLLLLLGSGSGINCKDREGKTPLDYAKRYGLASNGTIQYLRQLTLQTARQQIED
ncbi:unnamed protein product [Colletotrichum noveboracense]|uniref:Ankyrin repeat protein n=1 Tax=Colletotrichum noveboracense TaxID=2664923 RepID=A0A9W4RS29_9PEZI|nr:unnamed protein product [Colletotrichum noveboracense]